MSILKTKEPGLFVYYISNFLLQAIEVAQLMDEYLDIEDSRTVLKCIMIAETRIFSSSLDSAHLAAFNCFTAPWVYSKVVLLGVSFLENHKRHVKTTHLAFYLFRLSLSLCLLKLVSVVAGTTKQLIY